MSPIEVSEIEGSGTAVTSGYFLLRGTSGELRFELTVGAVLKAADEPPKITVVRDNGSILVTKGETTGTGGEYTYVLTPTQTASLDLLTATWEAKISGVVQSFTTHHEIVGNYMVSTAAIKASLPSGVTKTEEQIVEARNLAEGWLEEACSVAFRPRYARETLDGSGTQRLLLSNPQLITIREAEVGDTVVALESLKGYPEGVAWGEELWTEGAANVSIAYEHGFLVTPAMVSRAALRLARHFLVEDPSNYDERASSMSTDEAHYTFITPGMSGAMTSIPEVNVVIQHFRYASIA